MAAPDVPKRLSAKEWRFIEKVIAKDGNAELGEWAETGCLLMREMYRICKALKGLSRQL